MRIRAATYLTSAAAPVGFPPVGAPEVAFAGRSNVGKSSLINALVGVPGLARTSSTPGRTRLLSWFSVGLSGAGVTLREVRLVDLPGYGYAKVPQALRASWRPLVEAFVTGRETLALVVVILDARRGPEADDVALLEWLAEIGRPALVVLTKADKLPKSRRFPAAAAVKRSLGLAREPLLFSATSGEGTDPLWREIMIAVQSRS